MLWCTDVQRVSDSFVSLKTNETDLLTATATTPANVNMDASCQSFSFYQSGILDDPTCTRDTNHCITSVGYGTENGKDYWIFKNMFGDSWGDKGYIRIVRDKNQCGVAGDVNWPNSYPIVA
jgi:C1A family cysteine protease